MKTLVIDWLGSCPRCKCNVAVVNTEKGDDKFLYAGDELHCRDCWLEGEVDVSDDSAFASFAEPEDDQQGGAQ